MSILASPLQPLRVVSAADASDPADDKAAGVFSAQYHDRVRFAIDAGGAVNVQPLWWDEASAAWYRDTGQAKSFSAAGKYIFDIPALGKKCFLLVTSITGTSSIRYALAKTKAF